MNITDILPNFLRSAENPSTSLASPDAWLWGGTQTKSGVSVSQESALGIPAFWRGVELLSNTIASLPLNYYQNSNEGKFKLKNSRLYELLHDRPNDLMSSYEWRKMSQLHILMWGNAYSLISYSGSMPVEIMPFHPDQVTPVILDGKLWYTFQTENKKITVDSINVIHLKGLHTDGIKGKSVIQTLRENLGLAIASQESSATFYKKGLRLDGIITKPGRLDADGMRRLRKTWEKTYSSTTGQRVAILDDGMDFKAISMSAKDAEFLESRKFSIIDIARILSVPPHLLYSLERATFNNVEALASAFEKFDLRPRLVNWEQELNWKLLVDRKKYKIEFNVEGLLRGDIKTRGEFYKTLFNLAAISPNEIRIKENMNTYKGGDDKFIQLNMTKVNDLKFSKNGNNQNKDIFQEL